jgi:hypothetical protein
MINKTKIPYLIMALEVERLYSKEFPEGDDAAITKHCEYIASFINSCGYSEDEYMERWMREQDLNIS